MNHHELANKNEFYLATQHSLSLCTAAQMVFTSAWFTWLFKIGLHIYRIIICILIYILCIYCYYRINMYY